MSLSTDVGTYRKDLVDLLSSLGVDIYIIGDYLQYPEINKLLAVTATAIPCLVQHPDFHRLVLYTLSPTSLTLGVRGDSDLKYLIFIDYLPKDEVSIAPTVVASGKVLGHISRQKISIRELAALLAISPMIVGELWRG